MKPPGILTLYEGTSLHSGCTFTDVNTGNPEDPGVVTATLVKPDDSTIDVTSAVVNDSAGVYHFDWQIPLGSPGVWTVKWEGSVSGPIVVNAEQFIVREVS